MRSFAAGGRHARLAQHMDVAPMGASSPAVAAVGDAVISGSQPFMCFRIVVGLAVLRGARRRCFSSTASQPAVASVRARSWPAGMLAAGAGTGAALYLGLLRIPQRGSCRHRLHGAVAGRRMAPMAAGISSRPISCRRSRCRSGIRRRC